MSGAGKESKAGGESRVAHELARYETLFARRTGSMKSSAMRDMMALTERDDLISLAGGLPDTRSFPQGLFADLMGAVATRAEAALQYGPTEGLAATRGCIREVMAAEGTIVDEADLIVTTGGQQVLDLVCRALIDPGDVIVTEAPTYPGALPTFTAYEARIEQVDLDGRGMPVDTLEERLDALDAQGLRPKFIYAIPSFQNPGGETMTLARRRRLVELARERELLILEDNPYGMLRYEGEALPTLHTLDAEYGSPGMVIYLGTFSKIIAPGLRLGWALAPRPVLEKLNLAKQGADLCSSPVTQMFVAELFARTSPQGGPLWLDYVARLRDLYRARRDAMLAALTEQFAGTARWTRPEGGMFVWLTLDGAVDTSDLLIRARERHGVAFVPGRAAFADGVRGARSMRLNFAGADEHDLREAVRRIGVATGEQLELLGALSGRRAPQDRGEGAQVVPLPTRETDARGRAGL